MEMNVVAQHETGDEFWDERSTAFTASLETPRNCYFLTSWCPISLKISTDYLSSCEFIVGNDFIWFGGF